MFEGCNHSEGGHHGGEEYTEGEHGVDELPGWRNARVHILVVEAKGCREDEEDPEGKTSEGVAEHLAIAGLSGEHGVPGDVCGKQPEIHQWVTSEPEVGTSQLGINTFDQTE